MTLCRKCGREIPDGQELCEECQNTDAGAEMNMLDELMQNMDLTSELPEESDNKEEVSAALDDVEEAPVALDVSEEDLMALIDEEEPATEEPVSMAEDPVSGENPVEEEETVPESEEPVLMDESTEEESPLAMDEFAEEESPLAMDEFAEEESPLAMDEFAEEESPLAMDEFAEEESPLAMDDSAVSEEPAAMDDSAISEEPAAIDEDLAESAEMEAPSDLPGDDDIGHLLDMLSDDYEEKSAAEDESSDELDIELDQKHEPAETSLFSDDDSDFFFADSAGEAGTSGASMEDVFQDALSAVEYSDKDGGEAQEENPFAMEDSLLGASSEEAVPGAVSETPLAVPKKRKKKDSFWKRIFGNVVTAETAEEEAKERADELAEEEEKAKLKEEKRQQAETDKAEKAERVAAEKEQKAARKAELAAAKAAEKEEKKRLKLEQEANEVVGKINPVGATIVMVFFGVICLSIIFGTQIFSYSHAVNAAEDNFMAGDYEEAYQALAGVDVSESSQEMADQVRICMQLQMGIKSYNNYYQMKMYLEALDSLVKGIRRYDLNKDKADDYGILNQYNALENKIANLLYSEFGVTESQAREIIKAETQEAYTSQLEKIIESWSQKIKEDER